MYSRGEYLHVLDYTCATIITLTFDLSIPAELITLPPDYNENARQFAPKLFKQKQLSETCPTRPPAELLVGTLTQEWEEVPEDMTGLDLTPKIVQRKGSSSTNGETIVVALGSIFQGNYCLLVRLPLGVGHQGIMLPPPPHRSLKNEFSAICRPSIFYISVRFSPL